jgi:hypothetical protein
MMTGGEHVWQKERKQAVAGGQAHEESKNESEKERKNEF